VLELRYESIAADPAAAALTLARHRDGDTRVLEQGLRRFTATSIGRYRRDLTPEQIADVEREAGPLLSELGYA
jgi:hypothetical protein